MRIRSFQSFRSRFLVLIGPIAMAVPSLKAAPLYWDINGAAIYPAGAVPEGTWDGVTSNWSTSAAGDIATTTYVAGSAVVFSAGTGATGSFVVTLGSNQSATGLNFEEGHVTITPLTSPSSTSEILSLTGAAPTLNVQNMDSTIGSRLTASGLTKTGVGKITLNYGAANVASYFSFSGGALTINAGTVELTGTGGGANQLNGTSGIVINSGGTFLWAGAANNISDSASITVNTGGILISRTGDQIGNISGSGQIHFQGGSINLSQGNAVTTFSGMISGSGTLQFNAGAGSVTLTNANTFAGTITAIAGGSSAGSIRLGNTRAAQNALIKLNTTNPAIINLSFASGLGTFIVGSLEGTSNLVLQDVTNAAITLQAGNNDQTKTYSGILSGSGGLTKIGTGTLTLTGATSGANTYTGDTTINSGARNANSGSVNQSTAGTLKLNFSPAASPASNIINSASRLVLGGGRLLVAGKNDSTAVSQTFNNTLLNVGRSYVTVTPGTASAAAVVNLGAITRNTGNILEFTQPAGAQSTTNGITTTTANDPSGILGGWAIIGNDWAVKDTSGTSLGNVVAAGSGVYTTYAGGDIASSPTSNLLIDDASATITTDAGTTDVNTIMVRNSAAARTVDIAAGEILRLGATGSIWNQGGTDGTLTIGTGSNVGTLTAGGAVDTAGEIIINNTGNDFTIRSTIADNGAGAVTLVKTGTGQFILSGTNTFTGGAIFTQGRNRIDSSGALGSGAVTVTAGATLWLNSAGTFANDFFLEGTGYGENNIPGAIRLGPANTIGTSSSNITLTGDTRIGAVNTGATNVNTLAGKITGDYGLDLSGGAGGGNIIVLANTANDFTGNLSLNTNLNGTTAFTNTNAVVTARLGASEVIPNGFGKGNVILSGGTTVNTPVTLDLNGFNETINSLISYGTHANTFVTNNATDTTATLTIGDNNSSTLVASNAAYSTYFGGLLQDGNGILALTKIGEGTQTLTGANTYSGATQINKGILQAGAANTLSANSAVTLASDPTAMLALTNSLADFSQTIKSLAGGGTVNLGTIAAANATTLTTGDATNTVYSGTIVGAGGLAKQGSGTFTLTGINTYLGSTTVNAGTMLVHGSLTGTLGVNVTAGTFGGNGTVTGPISVAAGASLQGGDGVTAGDDLAIDGNISLASNSIIKLTLGAGLTHSSLARIGGDWVFNANQIFTFTGANFTTGLYDNIITGLTGSEAWLGNLSGWQITNAGFAGTFIADGTNVDLQLTAVPEPGALLSLAGGLGLLLGLLRRRPR